MTPFSFDPKVNFALLLSILSFLWAGVTFYLTFMRQGKLEIAPIRLFGLSTVEGENSNLAIALPLAFVNKGAKLLTVEDMKLNLGDNRPYFLWQTDLDGIPLKMKPSFASQFAVPGYTSISRNCGFVCDDPNFRLSAGQYEVKIEVLISLKWRVIKGFLIDIEEHQLNSIKSGGMIIKIGVLELLPKASKSKNQNT